MDDLLRKFKWAARHLAEFLTYIILAVAFPCFIFMGLVSVGLSAFGTNHGVILFLYSCGAFEACFYMKKFLAELCSQWFNHED